MQTRSRTRLPASVLVASVLALAACNRGPDTDAVRAELEGRLRAGFSEDVFAVRSVRRTGTAPFRDLERGISGLFVYYDAELEFLRDYSLTSWKSLNLGTLAFVLGAADSGIRGFNPQGNHPGDTLGVDGRLSYERNGKAWKVITTPAPPDASEAPSLEGTGPAAVLDHVRSLAQRDAEVRRGTRDAVIVQELRSSLERIDLRLATLDGHLSLGSRRPPGIYHAFGAAFTSFASEHGLPMFNYASEGSVDNGVGVQNGRLTFGLVQSDVAEVLFRGWSEQGMVPMPALRAVASLWPEAVHLVTLEDTGITSLADLRGKRLAIGAPGSGSRFNAIRVGVEAGLTADDFPEILQIGFAESIAALEAGEVDAVFATSAVPSPPLQTLAERRPDLVFVGIDRALVDNLAQNHFAYYPLVIPARTYPGQTEPVQTLGQAAVLITNAHTPDASVERVLAMILDSTDALARQYFRAGFISAETVRLGVAVPLHRAAERFYLQRKQVE